MLALLEWIPDDGAMAASLRGGRHWLGWTRRAELAAATWDLHAAVAHAKAGKKAKGKKAPTYPRPKATVRPVKRARGLADFARGLRPTDLE